MSEPINEFPNALRYNTLQFCANVLIHIRQREDTEMGTIGEILLPLMQQFRTVRPEYIDEFYELLTGLCTHLIRYSGLAESCSKSGAYRDRRLACLNVIKSMITEIEKQDDVVRMLRNMFRHTPKTHEDIQSN